MSAADPPNPDDPIDAYIEHLRGKGLGKLTVDGYESTLNNHLRPYLEENGLEAGEMTRNECGELIDEMFHNPNLDSFTAEKYAGLMRKFYAYYNSRGAFEVNPMELAMEDYDFGDTSEKYKREISIPEMREFIQQITHPLALAIIMILVKTGVRAGELCNIDMRDVHIDDSRVTPLFPELRPEIQDLPDSIYIERHDEMQAGQVTNGEHREASNKRKRATIIPIDDELKKVLVLWLALRPESNDPGNPFLARLTPAISSEVGDRLSRGALHRDVTHETEEWGWWDSSNSKAMNVSPHYFRHFFTTYMRERTNDGVFVQFIRGDTGNAAIDDYTHNWGDKVRTTYNKHIYKLIR
jgi:integrase